MRDLYTVFYHDQLRYEIYYDYEYQHWAREDIASPEHLPFYYINESHFFNEIISNLNRVNPYSAIYAKCGESILEHFFADKVFEDTEELDDIEFSDTYRQTMEEEKSKVYLAKTVYFKNDPYCTQLGIADKDYDKAPLLCHMTLEEAKETYGTDKTIEELKTLFDRDLKNYIDDVNEFYETTFYHLTVLDVNGDTVESICGLTIDDDGDIKTAITECTGVTFN